ncbi:MmcQ/YjbR family DNA-binding protein [Simiduia agarivorans]|uniref:MmcQ-like protein n=1 Tax=Simiduia agarivorans (strain DSM 21679 / JCM 13881 / BCRC 17597 / SA1) TaxID=1117647 RepID=K4KL54_SIMAS|nr:MmcQ/YjbR family DNA-binding protein [Simiduia agarivorans]AFU99889.1 hypothetical protein M5M_13755 [Simiduia agarivorans SA1 = DSM 21679]
MKPHEYPAVEALLLDQVGATSDMPFGPEVICYRVCGKIFAILAWQDSPMNLNLKCEPGRAMLLREQFAAIKPGYHMNKKHWNTLTLDGSLPLDFIREEIHHSYERVVAGLKKSERESLKGPRA